MGAVARMILLFFIIGIIVGASGVLLYGYIIVLKEGLYDDEEEIEVEEIEVEKPESKLQRLKSVLIFYKNRSKVYRQIGW